MSETDGDAPASILTRRVQTADFKNFTAIRDARKHNYKDLERAGAIGTLLEVNEVRREEEKSLLVRSIIPGDRGIIVGLIIEPSVNGNGHTWSTIKGVGIKKSSEGPLEVVYTAGSQKGWKTYELPGVDSDVSISEKLSSALMLASEVGPFEVDEGRHGVLREDGQPTMVWDKIKTVELSTSK